MTRQSTFFKGIVGLLGAASPMALALVGPTAPALAQAVNLGGGGANTIRADGRTKTRIVVNGNHTKITTKSIQKGVGFNSFADFKQAAGTQVDMYVPDQAGALVNVVRNGSVVVNGTLNAYKNGKIGGNVFFSSSDGFVVGAQGQINVGSLTVNTPTSGFLDRMIAPDGRISDALARQLMTGEIPVSKSGHIAIAGQINAQGAITLQGQTIRLSHHTGALEFGDLGQRTKFEATVNATGIVEGGRLVSRGGRIVIAAKDSAVIAGRVKSNAKATGGRGGAINLRAANLRVTKTARLSVDGAGTTGAGGRIVSFGDVALIAEDGARFSARATGAGAGGFVELSGARVDLGAVDVDVSSQTGARGTFLIDPFDLIVGGVSQQSGGSDNFSLTNSITSNGADVRLEADNSIRITGSGLIDSRALTGGVSTGDSGSITLVAPEITLDFGAQVLAAATAGSGFADGDVTMTATRDGGAASLTFGSAAGAATITGGNITLTATSTRKGATFLPGAANASAKIAFDNVNLLATKTLTAKASASADSGSSKLPVGVIVMDVDAALSFGGNSVITAAAMDLDAEAKATSKVETSSSLNPASDKADGAVAVSTINSDATIQVQGQANLISAGALTMDAVNTVTASADATPKQAQFGAAVGVSTITANTLTEITGNATVSATDLTLNATTATTTKVTAVATKGGASDNEDGSEAKKQLDDKDTGGQASTSGGKVSIVGALAISNLNSTTRGGISTTGGVTATGAVKATATSDNAAEITADGSAVEGTTGVGVAVGVNRAKIVNDAVVGGKLTAGSVDLAAKSAADGHKFVTTITSGAGASNVGVAGGLALNLIDTGTLAGLSTGGAVTISGGGAVNISAEGKTSVTGTAKPTEGGATGDKVGVGASVAMNILANRSTAQLADGTSLTGAGATALSAGGTFSSTAEAEAGSSGGISLTPSLGLSLVSNTTAARIGTGSALTTAGAVSLSAAQEATTTTKASGKAAGAKAAVGLSAAVAVVNDSATATIARDVTTSGDVTARAMGASASELTAEASALGAAKAKDDGTAPDGEKDVDGKVSDELTSANDKQKSAGVGDAKQQSKTDTDVADKDGRSASTSEGKVSVAAAVGVNVQNSTVGASTVDGTKISATGALGLHAAANAVGKVTSTGDAVGKKDDKGNTPPAAQVGIGVAVSVNKVKLSNTARLGDGAHNVGALALSALSRDVAALRTDSTSTTNKSDSYLAQATAGAGASKVGLAGALGLNLIDTQSQASVADGAAVTVGGGDVTIETDRQTDTTATAKPVGEGAVGESVGIGASVAINILANRSEALVEDGAVMTGVAATSLTAGGTHTAKAEASAGSSGGVSITPSLGLSIISNTAQARLGSGGNLTTTGDVSVAANQASTTTTNASGKAAGATAAIGASVAVALVDDVATATTARNISAGGKVGFSALGHSTSNQTVEASAVGAKGADDKGDAGAGDKDVNSNVDGQMAAGKDKQTKAGVGSARQQAATKDGADDKAGRSAETSEGKVNVAAAVGVNVQTNTVTAAVPDGVAITSGGALDLVAVADTDAEITTKGDAVGEADKDGNKPPQAQVGIGAAVSVNVVKERNSAKLGAATHSANGVNLAAIQAVAPVDTDIDTLKASATAGAGGSKVGIAGAVALNKLDLQNTAEISGAATVAAGTGASSIKADERLSATAAAAPVDKGASGDSVGIGASVGLNLIDARTSAQLTDGATMTGGAGLAVSANTKADTETTAKAGAEGGIAVDASVALALLDIRTTARVGTGAGLNMTGAVSATASNTGKNIAKSEGENKGGKVSVGASAAVIFGDGEKDGALKNTSVAQAIVARDVTATNLTISASSDRSYSADATATARGGFFDDKDEKKNSKTGGTATSADSLDKSKDSQSGTKDNKKVTVAAAAGIASAQDKATATLQGVSVDLSGDLSVTSDNKVSVLTSGSGAALDPKSKVGVGIGVGLSIFNTTSVAEIDDGATVTKANSVTVQTTSKENAEGDALTKVAANAIAGASSSKVSVAGAFAVGVTSGESRASIGDNVTIADGGAVKVTTENTSQISAKALAGSASQKVGVGASVAVAVSKKKMSATVGSGVDMTADSLLVKAENKKIDGPAIALKPTDTLVERLKSSSLLGASNYYVEALGGAAGNSAAVQGSFGVMTFKDQLTASVGRSQDGTAASATTVNAGGGAVEVSADNQITARALSGAISLSGKAAVGVASSVIVNESETKSELADGAQISNAASYRGAALADQGVQVFGVAVSGGIKVGVSGVASVLTTENKVEALMGKAARVSLNGLGAADLSASNTYDAFSLATGVGAGGTAGVGASGSVMTVKNLTRAEMADGTSAADRAEINTGGAVNIDATAKVDGDTVSVAGGAGGTAGVGAGAGVYVFNSTTKARAGDFAKVGSSQSTGSVSVSAKDNSTLTAASGAAGIGGTAGVGAAVSVGVLTKTTTAEIGQSAQARGKDVSVSAESTEDILGVSAGLGVGGSAGAAGSVVVNRVSTTTLAKIAENALAHADGSVGVTTVGRSQVDMVDAAVAGGTVGVGASVGVTILDNDTQAIIADGASIVALGGGDGLSYTTGYTPVFSSYLAGDDFGSANVSPSNDADAPVKASSSAANNDLTTSDDARGTGLALLTKKRTATRDTAKGTGVIVNAAGQTSTRSLSVGAAGGAGAVTLSASVPVVTTTVRAEIGDAQINQGVAGGAGQDVRVTALSDLYMQGFAGAISGGGAAFGAGVSMAVLNATTEAKTGSGANIDAGGDLDVRADAQQDFSTMAAAGSAAGGAALAGSASVTTLTTTTTATLGGTVDVEGNADVVAEDTTRSTLLAGSVAVGSVGAGAAVGVLNLNKKVTASVADNADVTVRGNAGARTVFGDVDPDGLGGTEISFGTTRASQGLNVLANSAQSAYTLGVAGGGGYAGLAGVVALNLSDIDTKAFIGSATKINKTNNAGAAAQQDVIVTARDTTVTDVAAGAIGIGLGGLAGTADIGIFKTNVAAYVENGAEIEAKRDVAISGLTNRDSDSFVVSGAIGIGALAAGVTVYSYGDGVASGGDADKQLADASDQGGRTATVGGMVSDSKTQLDDDTVDKDLLGHSDDDRVRSISSDAQAARQSVDLAGKLNKLSVPGGTVAKIGAAKITAGGAVGLASTDTTKVEIDTGAAAAGGVGLGAGVAVVTVDTGSTTEIAGAASITTGKLGAVAVTDHQIDVASRAAAAGLFAGLSADVAVVRDTSRTRAVVDGATITGTGAVNIGAGTTRRINAQGLGVSAAGSIAVGASVVDARIGGKVEARLANGSVTGSSASVKSKSDDQVTANTIAVSGGLGLAAQGSIGTARISTDVDTGLTGASITTTGATVIDAATAASASSDAAGIAVAGLGAAGASVADAAVGTDTAATLSSGASIKASQIQIGAQAGALSSSAEAKGASGALVGINATVAKAGNTAKSRILLNNSSLQSTGATSVRASSATSQQAQASGLAAGVVAAGLNTAKADSTSATTAMMQDMGSVIAGSLTVAATGSDTNSARAISGSGGLIAGDAAKASTSYTGTTKAGVSSASGTSMVVTGKTQITADQTTTFGGYVDTRQASLAGKSGANLLHKINSTVEADLGDKVTLTARDLDVTAANQTVNPFRAGGGGWNIDTISGGLASVPAGGVTVNVTHNTQARIGDNAKVTLIAPTAPSQLSGLKIVAQNTIGTHQKAKLDSGGVIATAKADINTSFTANASATIGTGADVIVQRGDIVAAAYGAADVDIRSNATTYGLSGAPIADADATYTGKNRVTVGKNARVEAQTGITPLDGSIPRSATIRLAAGKTETGATPTLAFNATADAYNKTAFPIPTAPNPEVRVTNTGRVFVDTSAGLTDGVRAAGDIMLQASQGDISARAKGYGKDIYREALAKVASAISKAFGGGEVSFAYHGGTTSTRNGVASVRVDGVVETGLQRVKQIQFRYRDTPCNAEATDCLAVDPNGNISFKLPGQVPVGTTIVDRVNELEELKKQYAEDPVAVAAYTTEIRFLQNKLVDLGLGTFVGGVFQSSQFIGLSPKQKLQEQAALDKQDLGTVEFNLTGNVTVDVTDALTSNANEMRLTYFDSQNGLEKNTNAALATIATLTKYDLTKAPQKTARDAVVAALAEGKAAADALKSKEADTLARRATVQSLTQDLKNAQNDLETARLAKDTAAANTALGKINTAKSGIQAQLVVIKSNADAISAQGAIAKARADTVESQLKALIAAVPTNSDANKAQQDAAKIAALKVVGTDATQGIGGALYNVEIGAQGVGTFKSELDSETSNIATRVGVLNAATVTPGTVAGDNSLTQYVDLITTKTDAFADNTIAAQTASNTLSQPMTSIIEVDDTVARLGNISVEGDLLTGTGKLNAPGDASISIDNFTSNTLKLGSLLIPTYDAANVRMNGFLVQTNADVNVQNNAYLATRNAALPGGTATTANMADIVTSLTSSRGNVTVNSHYNTDDLAFFNPALPEDPNNPKSKRRVPPDIILKTGSVIENTKGAVNITSAQGNIYINGQINAGSVNILAKNGDFVSSFVNGFNHIGGDPASFNSPTNAAERGAGITANGSVSISARFLNINSRIQSGIADWTLNLTASKKLTVAPDVLGLAASVLGTLGNKTVDLGNGQSITVTVAPIGKPIDPDQLAALVAQYKAEIVNNPGANPVRTVNAGDTTIQINLKDYLTNSGGNTQIELSLADARKFHQAKGGDALFSVLDAGNIGAAYDPATDSFVVNGATVSGGYIEVFGQIINTSKTGGELRALDGFGKINVTNTSGKPIVLRNLSTGKDNNGDLRGTAGLIRLTDVVDVNTSNADNPVVRVMVTDYTFNSGADRVEVDRKIGTIDNKTGNIVSLSPVNVGPTAGRKTSYTPGVSPLGTKYPRYVWTELTKATRVDKATVTRSQFFGSDKLTFARAEKFSNLVPITPESTERLKDGTYLSINETRTTPSTRTASNGFIIAQSPSNQSNVSLNGQDYLKINDTYLRQNPEVVLTNTKRNCNWWTLCVASKKIDTYRITQRYNIITTNTLKANHPISVEFIGSKTGQINVQSNSDVILTSRLANAAGNTTISADGDIVQGTLAARMDAVSFDLSATGSVGGVTSTLAPDGPTAKNAWLVTTMNRADQTVPVGTLKAVSTNGNVAVRTQGGMVVDQVRAENGRVDLVSQRGISVANPAAAMHVRGERVNLQAINGNIGTATQAGALKVDTAFIPGGSDREFGDPDLNPALRQDPKFGLSATASGEIGIKSSAWAKNTTGSILVDKVTAFGGDVLLSAQGRILDNNPVERVDARTYNELLAFWDTLGLVEGTAENEDKQQVQIKAFEASNTQSYREYWEVRGTQPDPTVYDPTFKVTVAPGSAQFRALSDQFTQQAIDEGIAPAARAAFVTAKIGNYEAQRTAGYHTQHALVGGLTASFDKDFAYVATAADRAKMLGGAKWTERELAFSLAPGALKTVTGTNPVSKDPNVTGRNVTLKAFDGLGETVNQGAGVKINSAIKPEDLTDAQKVALAAAERNDLTLELGQIVDPGAGGTAEQQAAYAKALAAGVTNPVGTTDIPLGTAFDDLSAKQQAALDAAALGLVADGQTTLAVLTKRPLNFETPGELTVDVTQTPGAGVDRGNSYLASRTDALLAKLTTKGEMRVKVLGNIRDVANPVIDTGGLILEAAAGGVGSAADPINLGLAPGVAVVARGQDGVFLDFAQDGMIDTVYSPGAIKLTAQGFLENANNDKLVNVQGTAVTLTSQTASIGRNGRALNVGVNLGGKIDASAPDQVHLFGSATAPLVLGNVTAGQDILVGFDTQTTALGVLRAGRDLTFDGSDRLVFGTSAQAGAARDVTLTAQALKQLNGSATTATAGTVQITTTDDAVVTGITAGSAAADAVTVTSGGRIFAGTLDPRTDISATATGAGVVLTAAKGIGDKTQANDKATDLPGDPAGSANAVTDVVNPLRINSGMITATALDGGVALSALSQATIKGVTALKGAVEVDGASDLRFDTVTSGGGQTLTSGGALSFTTLTSNGLPTDDGTIAISAVGAVTGGDVTANGGLTVQGQAVAFDTATTGQGVAVTATEKVKATSIIAGTDSTVTAGQEAELGVVVAAGNSTVTAGDGVTFDTIDAGTDNVITAGGDITGNRQVAGAKIVDRAGSATRRSDIKIGVVSAPVQDIESSGNFTFDLMEVAERADLKSDQVTGTVRQVPSGPDPLRMTVTGGFGATGTSADLVVDAPAGLVVEDLDVVDTAMTTTARKIDVEQAHVPGALVLTTPEQVIDVNNRSPQPRGVGNVQMFDVDQRFAFSIDDRLSATDATVIIFDTSAQSQSDTPGDLVFDGISLTRDSIRVMAPPGSLQNTSQPGNIATEDDDELLQSISNSDTAVVIDGVEYQVFYNGTGPALLLQQGS